MDALHSVYLSIIVFINAGPLFIHGIFADENSRRRQLFVAFAMINQYQVCFMPYTISCL